MTRCSAPFRLCHWESINSTGICFSVRNLEDVTNPEPLFLKLTYLSETQNPRQRGKDRDLPPTGSPLKPQGLVGFKSVPFRMLGLQVAASPTPLQCQSPYLLFKMCSFSFT